MSSVSESTESKDPANVCVCEIYQISGSRVNSDIGLNWQGDGSAWQLSDTDWGFPIEVDEHTCFTAISGGRGTEWAKMSLDEGAARTT